MSKLLKAGLLLAVCVACCGVYGDGWFVRGNKYNVETVIVTGNYKSPRLMADLIQAESRQPYIIVPAANSADNLCYLAMPKSGQAVPKDRFGAIISYTRCRRVVILGDTNCVPEKYETMIDRNIPVVRITGDWERVAEELTFLLNLSNLKRNYPKLRRQLNVTYQPVSAPAPRKGGAPAIPAAKEAPAAGKASAPAVQEAPASGKASAPAAEEAPAAGKAPAPAVQTIPPAGSEEKK